MEPVARHFLALFLAFIVIVIVIEAEVYGTCCQLMLEREHEDITVHEVQIYSVSMQLHFKKFLKSIKKTYDGVTSEKP